MLVEPRRQSAINPHRRRFPVRDECNTNGSAVNQKKNALFRTEFFTRTLPFSFFLRDCTAASCFCLHQGGSLLYDDDGDDEAHTHQAKTREQREADDDQSPHTNEAGWTTTQRSAVVCVKWGACSGIFDSERGNFMGCQTTSSVEKFPFRETVVDFGSDV